MGSDILSILNLLASDSKKHHKTGILLAEKENTLLHEVIFQALSPYAQFYIRKIPAYTHRPDEVITLVDALGELKKLSDRELTGNLGIAHLQTLLCRLAPGDAVVLERIIGKDLRCGVAEGIVNAVYQDFIPSYPCLLARPYDAKNIKNIKYPAISQLKADGVRANLQILGNDVLICGRSGKPMDFLGVFDEHALGLRNAYGKDCVFDGELVVLDKNGKILNRKTGNGIINKAIKGTISEEEAKQVRFQLWDIIPYEEFAKKKSTKVYRTRLQELENVLNDNNAEIHLSWIIEGREVKNLEDAELHFTELLCRGEEGTILKNYSGIWEDKRSKDLVKMKAEKDADLEIIGWKPGTGKYLEQVGSLQCASSDRKVEANISGFSEELRLWITENIVSLQGRIIAVLYNERISSKAKGREAVDSLFLPRFQELREDKFVADSSAEIT